MMRCNFNNRFGFTLIELLTVIAIMAVLAGILFPVLGSMQEHSAQAHCMSNLHAIWTALRQYKLDEGVYPDKLLVDLSDNTTTPRVGGLYPEYITSLRTFTCPDCKYTNQFGIEVTPVNAISGADTQDKFIPISSYDGTWTSGTTFERHYDRYRLSPGDAAAKDTDYRRQLIVRYPLDDTVITWCSYHRSAPSYVAKEGQMDIVLWLNGTAAKMDSTAETTENYWRMEPKS